MSINKDQYDHRQNGRVTRCEEEGRTLITLDTCGLTCPEPVMLLHGVVRDAVTGDAIHIKATDPAAERDITKFCLFLGHQLIGVEKRESTLYIDMVKG